MDDYKLISDVINQSVKDYSYTSVLLSSCVFIVYTIIIKTVDYFRNKTNQKPLVEMSNAVKEVSNNVVKLNMILDKLFQDALKKEVEKSKNIVELAFSNFQYKLSMFCRNVIINNNIDINKALVVSNLKRVVNAEYYKVYHTLSLYEVEDKQLSLFIKEEWKEECINDIIDIIYNSQEDKIRITQINNNINVKVNDWIVYINNKYAEYE